MKKFISDIYEDTEIITPDDSYHYFFGYYDMRATSPFDDKKHLCHRVTFMDRLPNADDECELGYLEDGKFHYIATTTAWNFQQGAMFEYHPYLKDTVIYNSVVDGKFVTVTHNYVTNEKMYADKPTACHSPDGKYGLSVNFGRIFAFRPGYGYEGFVDESADINAPENDGVFLTDLISGKSKILIGYTSLSNMSGFNDDDKVLVNHITFNKTSDRYVVLVRNFPKPGGWWSTSMLVGDLRGNIKPILKNTYVSHYNWLNDHEIVAHCCVNNKNSLFLLNVDTGEAFEYKIPYSDEPGNPDIHCNYSPDGKYIIGDGYPHDHYRSLVAINAENGSSKTLFKVLGDNPPIVDIRCDLHARFVFGGKYISYDTIHNGKRQIGLVSADKLNF